MEVVPLRLEAELARMDLFVSVLVGLLEQTDLTAISGIDLPEVVER